MQFWGFESPNPLGFWHRQSVHGNCLPVISSRFFKGKRTCNRPGKQSAHVETSLNWYVLFCLLRFSFISFMFEHDSVVWNGFTKNCYRYSTVDWWVGRSSDLLIDWLLDVRTALLWRCELGQSQSETSMAKRCENCIESAKMPHDANRSVIYTRKNRNCPRDGWHGCSSGLSADDDLFVRHSLVGIPNRSRRR